MIEIQVPITIGNESARALRREIKAFLSYLTDKVVIGEPGTRSLERAGQYLDKHGAKRVPPDRHGTATRAYVAMRTILARLEQEIARQDARDAVAARPTPPKQPTIREQRGR